MKKILLIAAAIIAVVVTTFFIVNNWMYPDLPIDSITPKEAIQKLNESDQDLVEISKESNRVWYITKNPKSGAVEVDENIKKFISSNGWDFKEIDGSGLFFEKNGETLIVVKEMWTKRYVLVKVPSHF
ncbi:hypothetical protein ACOI1C_14725 [Bacillus sp. DJP31]|uniref:hypothetical protein n=1 Tax=Bacillus sp. DJP31 TaxID=3409789 RepID=UPI003BB7C4D1